MATQPTRPRKRALASAGPATTVSPPGPRGRRRVPRVLTFQAWARRTAASVFRAALGSIKTSQAKQVASRAGRAATPRRSKAPHAQVAQLAATVRTLLPPLLRLYSRHVPRVPSTASWVTHQPKHARTAQRERAMTCWARVTAVRVSPAQLARMRSEAVRYARAALKAHIKTPQANRAVRSVRSTASAQPPTWQFPSHVLKALMLLWPALRTGRLVTAARKVSTVTGCWRPRC